VHDRSAARAMAAGAVCCGVLALSTACSNSPGPADHPSSGPASTASGSSAATSAAVPQLTPARARQAFNAFFPRYAAMVKHHAAGQVASLAVGAQAQVMAFSAAKDAGLAPGAQVTERFYVPRVTAYPRWFAEVGTTRSHGAPGGDAFVMVQSQPAGPWRVADTFSWAGQAPAQLAAIAVDAGGYATAVPPGDTSVVTPPGQLPAQYARVVGGAGSASRLYAPGDPTTAWTAVQHQIVRGAPAEGWQVGGFGYAVPAGSEYALRTADGGAVVFFAFSQRSTWQVRSASPRFSGGAIPFDGRLPITYALDAGLSGPHPRIGTRITSTYVFEPLALDPADGKGKISLMDHDFDGGGLISATTG
jgi:hypothetical protein